MDKKRIITIAGKPGSGKSTTAKAVADKLDLKHFSSGDYFRQLAKAQGLDLLDANLSAEKNIELDSLVDKRLQAIGQNEDRFVIDSRLAWYWIPNSFKVFLNLDLETAAQRIIESLHKRQSANEQIPSDPTEYAKILHRRLDSENLRYKTMYDIYPYNLSNYDLVVDTAVNNLEQVVEQTTKAFETWLKS